MSVADPLQRALRLLLKALGGEAKDSAARARGLLMQMLFLSELERRGALPGARGDWLARLEPTALRDWLALARHALPDDTPHVGELIELESADLVALAGTSSALIVPRLGPLFEQLLDRRADTDIRHRSQMSRARRARGRYYTHPRLAAFIVRQALPLDPELSGADLLRLRVLDPAVGGGVFLLEAALWLGAGLAERTGLSLREATGQVVGRCLHGVDIDQEAVQATRWELLLAAAGPENTELPVLGDRLRRADALIGAERSDLPWGLEREASEGRFEREIVAGPTAHLTGIQRAGPTAHLTGIQRAGGSLAIRAADAFTAACLHLELPVPSPGADPARYLAEIDAAGLTDRLASIARAEGYIHWDLSVSPVKEGGFDAVIGNPPYLSELRGGSSLFARLKAAPRAGRYYVPKGDLFYLFMGLGIDLLRPGGTLGVIVPPYWRTRTAAERLRQQIQRSCRVRARVELGECRVFEDAQGHHSEILVLERLEEPVSTSLHLPGTHTGPGFERLEERVSTSLRPPGELAGPGLERVEQPASSSVVWSGNGRNETWAGIPSEGRGRTARAGVWFRILDPRLSADEAAELLLAGHPEPGRLECLPISAPRPEIEVGPPSIDLSLRPTFTLSPQEISQGVVMPQATLSRDGLSRLPPGSARVGDGIFWLRDSELETLKLDQRERAFAVPYLPVASVWPCFLGNPEGWLLYLDALAVRILGTAPERYPRLVAHLQRFAPAITSSRGPFGLHRPRQREWFESSDRILVVRKTLAMKAARGSLPRYVDQGMNVIRLLEPGMSRYLLGVLHSTVVDRWLRRRKSMGLLLQVDKDVLCELPIPRAGQPSLELERKMGLELATGGIDRVVRWGVREAGSHPEVARAAIETLVAAWEERARAVFEPAGGGYGVRKSRPGRGGAIPSGPRSSRRGARAHSERGERAGGCPLRAEGNSSGACRSGLRIRHGATDSCRIASGRQDFPERSLPIRSE